MSDEKFQAKVEFMTDIALLRQYADEWAAAARGDSIDARLHAAKKMATAIQSLSDPKDVL